MSLISHITAGFKNGFKYPKQAFIFVLSVLLFTSFLGLGIWSWLDYSLGHTSYITKLLQGYDHDLIQDLIVHEGAGYHIFRKIFVWTIIMFIFFAPFLTGGILGNIIQQTDTFKDFLIKGSRYYFPFLKIEFIFILIHFVTLAIIIATGMLYIPWSLENQLSEIPSLLFILIGLLIYVFLSIFYVSASTISKYKVIQEGNTVWYSFKKAWRFVLNNKLQIFFLGFIYLIITIIAGLVLNFILNYIVEKNLILVIVAILVQLIILYIRSYIRISFYNSLFSFTNKNIHT